MKWKYMNQNKNKMGVREGSLGLLTILWGGGRRFLIQKFMLHYSSDLSLKTFLCVRRDFRGWGSCQAPARSASSWDSKQCQADMSPTDQIRPIRDHGVPTTASASSMMPTIFSNRSAPPNKRWKPAAPRPRKQGSITPNA